MSSESQSTEQQRVLLVGVCAGRRCAALRNLDSANPHRATVPLEHCAPGACSESEELIRHAIRARAEAVLVSVPCLGPCSHASVTAVGAGLAGDQRLTWLGRPTVFGLTETPERARALADWIGTDAPNPQHLPAPLRRGT